MAGRADRCSSFERRTGTGAFHVEYHDGAALSGRFIRSLRDKIHTLNRTKPEPFNIKPVHSLRGRVRLEVTGISERQLATLTMLSTGLPGVKLTRHRPGSRTTLVVYDPEKASEGFIRETLLKSNPDDWAREWHKPTPIRWGGALGGTSTLIACLTGAAPFWWLAAAITLNTARPLGRSIAALRKGEISIDLLDVAATFAALATRRPITAAFVEPEPGNEEYAVGLGLSARVQGRRVRVGRATWMEIQKLEIGLSFKKHLARFKKDGNSSLCVAVDEEVVGLVAYSDRTRPESAAIVERLQGNGRRKIVLLSGDSPEVVKNVARAVGIDEAVGGLLPEQKAEYVRKLRAAGRVVAMVGDGINDAPALASADVEISFAGSADVALETADVVLLDRGLVGLEKAFQIGDRAISEQRRAITIANADPDVLRVIRNGESHRHFRSPHRAEWRQV